MTLEIEYRKQPQSKEAEELIKKVILLCYQEENLSKSNLYVSVILVDDDTIRQMNKEHRKIDKVTDVLSFPMFASGEEKKSEVEEPLGDIVICIPQIVRQAKEFGNTFERELCYMTVHGFYHLMGYDHIIKEDKVLMRKKEEAILEKI